MEKIKVTQVRSSIGKPKKQRLVLESLGLKKIGSSKIHEATPSILGMVNKVKHLITVENI
ncbi:MAG: 50S ribosomal protein L30 [Bacteroidales bacterium]|jgi:large subunit ribosomal protein L30